MSHFFVIAVDGHAASGKGTLARRLADQFHLSYLDTGALYRLVGKRILDEGKKPNDPEAALSAAIYVRDHLSWAMLDDPALRTEAVSNAASQSCIFPAMREVLLDTQRLYAQHPLRKPGQPIYQGSVLDGRDIGTVVCPNAEVKLFVTASAETRAKRRFGQLQSQGDTTSYEVILGDMLERDARDEGRSTAPLKPAIGAVIIDTSEMDAETVFEKAVEIVREKLS